MTEFLSKFDSGELIGLFAMAGGFLCALSAIVGGILAKCWRHARELSFKEELLARGLSAEEVRTVIDSGAEGAFGNARCHTADPLRYT